MRGAITRDPELVEEVPDLARDDPFKIEAAKQVGLRLVGRSIETGLCGDELRQNLPELSKLDQARVRIVAEVALRQCAQAHQLGVMLPEEPKIGGCRAYTKQRDMRRNPPDFNSTATGIMVNSSYYVPRQNPCFSPLKHIFSK